MRWFKNRKPTTYMGDQRTVKRFLLIPTCLLNREYEEEYRWLEVASIKQVYRYNGKWCWEDNSWVD